MKKITQCASLALAALLAATLVGCGSAPVDTVETQDAEAKTSTSSTELLSDHDATFYTDQNERKTLVEIANGKPLVINYWATWCPYCVQELPDFLDIYRDYQDKVSFAFVDSTDADDETVENVTQWLADNEFDELPVYYDLDFEAQQSFDVFAYPTTVLVASDGTIVASSSGAIDPDAMRSALDSLA